MNKKIRVILAGTGKFSAEIFEAIIKDSDFEVLSLISQPNRKMDRNKNILTTEVFNLAQKYNIEIFQPLKISEIYDELAKKEFDFFITASFGQFIPSSILKLPKILPLNVHGSLLEKYRGAAPIQYALLNNDIKTGLTLIEMTSKMDAGDMLFKTEININENDTALEIFDKLAKTGADNICKWIKQIFVGDFVRIKQDESKVMLAPKILNDEAELFFSLTKKEALSKIRAFNDQPGAFILYNEKRLKIFRATNMKISTPISLNFADGKLYLIEYQFEGKKRVKHEI
ncbi:methionyl-tRNA formyltransferase [Metamycoplasma equirhinis]|uniref:methionyl-tRNA formyltransferase n=1 Tax=Metamycoplasma equirhinis TaxID=92402 RepID=UPI00359447EF